jgi:activator of HSP90 ATPase
VNNWHWTEKDLTEWAKTRLGELVAGLQLTQAPFAARTTKLESMTGAPSLPLCAVQ